jgi:hypothetical protein
MLTQGAKINPQGTNIELRGVPFQDIHRKSSTPRPTPKTFKVTAMTFKIRKSEFQAPRKLAKRLPKVN